MEEAHTDEGQRTEEGYRRTMKLTQNMQKTECVLCSEDWRDIVIMYVPHINNITIEDNYADISQDEIKKAYKQNKRRPQKKGVDL